jgi:hypothetical protein
MFNGWIIFAAIVSVFAVAPLCLAAQKRRLTRLARALNAIGLVGAIYCVAAGIYLLIGWQDPFANADPMETAKAIHSPKAGLIVLLIRFFPYALIALGVYTVYIYGPPFRRT